MRVIHSARETAPGLLLRGLRGRVRHCARRERCQEEDDTLILRWRPWQAPGTQLRLFLRKTTLEYGKFFTVVKELESGNNPIESMFATGGER